MRSPAPVLPRRQLLSHLLTLGAAGAIAGCAAPAVPLPRPAPPAPVQTESQTGHFIMRDGARLPYRAWLPAGPMQAVMLALHGINDSRDAWEVPAPAFAAAGIGLYGPDQRGFGAAPGRGIWPGAEALTDDAQTMLAEIAARHPGVKLVALGESMGGAVLMRLAATRRPAGVAGYVLAAPAVWGRAEMDLFLRSGLWLVSRMAPDFAVTGGGPIRVWASDNLAALRRLSRDPLTLRSTRFATVRGLVDLMDDALAAAGRLDVPAFVLYGAHDELVPPRAMQACWRAVPPGAPVRLAYYPNDYHLLLRDLGRAAPIGDVVSWIGDPAAPLPSGADIAAEVWLREAV